MISVLRSKAKFWKTSPVLWSDSLQLDEQPLFAEIGSLLARAKFRLDKGLRLLGFGFRGPAAFRAASGRGDDAAARGRSLSACSLQPPPSACL